MAFYRDQYCLQPVSKNTKGELKVRKQKRDKCKKPSCATLKVGYRLALEVSSHLPCDKFRKLDGRLRAALRVATQDDGHGRGFHQGRFRWDSPAGTVTGQMRGITNAGTHRVTPHEHCEKCNELGHMEGQLVGRFVNGRYKGCRVYASYVLNYDPGVQGQDTGSWGTIEGATVCKCKA